MPLDLHKYLLLLSPESCGRVRVRPGLTGLAQVYGGYGLDPSNKVSADLLYIQRMNPLLDIKLMIMSVWNTVSGGWETHKGAKVTGGATSEQLKEDR